MMISSRLLYGLTLSLAACAALVAQEPKAATPKTQAEKPKGEQKCDPKAMKAAPKKRSGKPQAQPAKPQVEEAAPVVSADTLPDGSKIQWVREEHYDPYQVPKVNLGLNMVTTFQLPANEKIIDVQAGNPNLWGITPILQKNVIYVKPTVAADYTNFVAICKSGNMYTFFLQRVDAKKHSVVQMFRVLPPASDPSLVRTPGEVAEEEPRGGGAGPMAVSERMSLGRGVDPTDVQKLLTEARAQEKAKAEQEKRAFAEAMLANRHDDYEVSYDRWSPFSITHVFDVDGVTYIRFKSKDNTQPNFFVLGEKGQEEPVHWTPSPQDPSVLIVDQVFARGVLAVGKKKAQIVNKGLVKDLATTPAPLTKQGE